MNTNEKPATHFVTMSSNGSSSITPLVTNLPAGTVRSRSQQAPPRCPGCKYCKPAKKATNVARVTVTPARARELAQQYQSRAESATTDAERRRLFDLADAAQSVVDGAARRDREAAAERIRRDTTIGADPV